MSCTAQSSHLHIPSFIPIYTTRKIHNLLLDIGWGYSYQLPVNEKFIPIDLDEEIMLSSQFSKKKEVVSMRWRAWSEST